MKRLVIFTVLAMIALAGYAWAETYKFSTEKLTPPIERKIEVVKQKEFIEVTVYPDKAKPIVYRIWPCGMIQRMEWKEVSPNAERNTLSIATPSISSSSDYIITPGTTLLYDSSTRAIGR